LEEIERRRNKINSVAVLGLKFRANKGNKANKEDQKLQQTSGK